MCNKGVSERTRKFDRTLLVFPRRLNVWASLESLFKTIVFEIELEID